ncbi:VOC family protein [Caballeronia sp. DA-9]|uniref:VOC family protein n=1 Tax=Caballeronia sp. DA-9 TaxID=3436237 RepID=UPI003F66A5FE
MNKIEFWYDHAAISVPNLDEAIAWYGMMFGFTLEKRIFLEEVQANIAMMTNGNLRIEIFEVRGAKPPSEDRRRPNEDIKTFGNKHISFAVEDVTALHDELVKRGADIVWLKKFTFGSNIFMRDHAGNLIEIVQRGKPALTASVL